MIILLTAMAGALGSLCRYLISGLVQQHSKADFPLGTLTVNLSGAFALGLLAGATQLVSTESAVGAGFLGGFTTYSTWMIETVRLGLTALRPRALVNLVLTLAGGLAVAAGGYSLTN